MTGSADTIVIQLENITMAFGGLVAVNDVSIIVPSGLRGTIIGPNGAGKTTLFRIISGEIFPTSGKTIFFGKDVTRWPAHRRAHLGLGRTYQVTNIFEELTVEENVTLAALGISSIRYRAWKPLRLTGELSQRVNKALHDVHIEKYHSQLANELSHGQQRQLEIALALVSHPQLLLLDEPAAGLASGERRMIAELIMELPQEMTILIIEHDLDLAFGLSERIICMNYGEIIADGTPEEIRSNDYVQEVYMGID